MKKFLLTIIALGVLVFGSYKLYFWTQKKAKNSSNQTIDMQNEAAKQMDVPGQGQQPKGQPGAGGQPLEDSGDADILELSEEQEVALIKKCENSEWVDLESTVAAGSQTFVGKVTADLASNAAGAETVVTYYLDKRKLVSSQEQTLGFFEARQVELQGKEENGQLRVGKIRCTGKETDKSLDAYRQEIMNHISTHLSELSPEKGTWDIVDFLWPNNNNVYVEFEKAGGDDENETMYSLLLEVAKNGQDVTTKQVAFMKMGAEDEDWKLLSGQDKFQAVDEPDYYEYEEALKKWVKYE